jgi:rhodanese-related sulfurtransferase
MSILDYFKPTPTWSAEQVRKHLDRHDPESYNLIDVRQPGEYEQGHLAGAKLIPLGELEEKLAELDPTKPTVAY